MPGRLARLCLKELREILRDRRTMITLVMMPLLVYPLLAIVFQRFLLSSSLNTSTVPSEYLLGFESEELARRFETYMSRGEQLLQQRAVSEPDSEAAEPEGDPASAATAAQAGQSAAQTPKFNFSIIARDEAAALVSEGTCQVAILYRTEQPPDARGRRPFDIQMIYSETSPLSEAALRQIEKRLQLVNQSAVERQFRDLGVTMEVPARIELTAVDSTSTAGFSLAALLPLILVLMTVTGAVYPAIDLTAGERERGTLETLIAAPVPRLGLLLAKYVAVLTVALLTAVVNLTGMTITVLSIEGLDQILLGGEGLSFGVVIKVLALLGLLAAFFSAVLLILTSYARSFKEAQAAIIPLMLLCLLPGIVCLMPHVDLTAYPWLAVTPLVNIVLLARDLFENNVNAAQAAIVVASTAVYVVGALAMASRIFGTDAVLYGSQASWSELFQGGGTRQDHLPVSAVLGCLAVLFPCYFVLSGLVARSPDRTFEMWLLLSALVTALLFAGLPALCVALARVPLAKGLMLKWPSLGGLAAAAILGLSLWPFAHEAVVWSSQLGVNSVSEALLERASAFLTNLQEIGIVPIVVALGIVPAVCEELFFRGFLMSAFLRAMTPLKAIIASAVLFGAFHVVTSVLAIERFLPSTLLGLVLGWVCYRTGSVLPGIVLHMVHNSLLLVVVHRMESLSAVADQTGESLHLPATWLAAAALGTVVGGGLLLLSTRRREQPATAAALAAN